MSNPLRRTLAAEFAGEAARPLTDVMESAREVRRATWGTEADVAAALARLALRVRRAAAVLRGWEALLTPRDVLADYYPECYLAVWDAVPAAARDPAGARRLMDAVLAAKE